MRKMRRSGATRVISPISSGGVSIANAILKPHIAEFLETNPKPSEKEVREAETRRVLQAPVRARIVVPMQFVPNLISALQEHLRSFGEGTVKIGPPQEPVH